MDAQNNKQTTPAGFPWKPAAVVVLGVSAIALLHSFSLFPALMYLSATGGILICSVIVFQDLGKNSAIARRFCTEGDTSQCNKVLTHGVLWKGVTLGDVGLSYFGFQLLYLWLSAATDSLASSFSLLSVPILVSLAVTAGLVIYQGFYIRQWCRLCLTVTGIIGCQAILLTISAASAPLLQQPGGSSVIFFSSCLVLAASWLVIKPILVKGYENANIRQQFIRFRRTPSIFIAVLRQQRWVQPLPASEHDIRLGDPDAPYQLLSVLHPYCQACAEEFFRLRAILARFPGTFSLTVYFHVPAGLQDGREMRTAQNLYAAYLATADKEMQVQLLMDWFRIRNLGRWSRKWGVTSPPPEGHIF